MKFCITFAGCLFLLFAKLYAQCPENIGFEEGDLNNWKCYVGSIDPKGVISLTPSAAVPNRHTITQVISNRTAMDAYGLFPMVCPNGSRYSLKLGNDQSNAEAERVSYTFNVPANQQDFVIIYNYAVVFQNPTDHAYYEQPKFTAKVFDVAANKYVDCGSFEFVASSNLPGFQQTGNNVYFKPWSPITINLKGYQGKTLRLEFTTNDCTRGSHFGYAYVDVNENCTSPITGNIYCAGKTEVNLSYPAGFKEYYWYNADFSKVLGTTNTLNISPLPPDGTRYALRVVPYPGLGCEDTLYTTVSKSKEAMNLVVQDSVFACESDGVNFKAGDITKGSSTNLVFSYYRDPDAQDYIQDPYNIKTSGTYYIKGENPDGCTDIKPIVVKLEAAPFILITNPPPVCVPDKIDLSQSSIVAGNISSLSYSYWKDAKATIPVVSPKLIDSSGTYYIKGINSIGCYQIVPVAVQIGHQPKLTVNKVAGCAFVNLTIAAITAGSEPNLVFSYWKDAAATSALASPDKITTSGTYYLKAANTAGCFSILPLEAQVFPLPNFRIKKPLPVNFPATVNLTGSDSLTYTFWRNASATVSLENPAAVQKSGTYYIKATSNVGCTLILPVTVEINPPIAVEVFAANTFTPNNDGTNDFFRITVKGFLQLNYLRIFNRYGQQVFETKQLDHFWDGTFNGSKTPVGTYYWVLEGTDSYSNARTVKSGSITVIR